jgi:flavorubredoxin
MNTPSTLAPDPYRVAADTWIIPELFPAVDGLHVPINSAVILGAEPVIVDTGTHLNRTRWLDAVWSLVDPADVRWVFLSHDDHDHVGNLVDVMDLCPRATLVTTWFSLERLAGDVRFPLDRCRWVNDGEQFSVGDRSLVALRPPVFDAPTTRGLFDPRTGFYWAADSFCSLVPGAVTDVAELDGAIWEETFLHLNRLISPWLTLADPGRYDEHLRRLASYPITTVAGAHGTAATGSHVARSFALLHQAVRMEEAREPGQSDLEAMLAGAMAGAAG